MYVCKKNELHCSFFIFPGTFSTGDPCYIFVRYAYSPDSAKAKVKHIFKFNNSSIRKEQKNYFPKLLLVETHLV